MNPGHVGSMVTEDAGTETISRVYLGAKGIEMGRGPDHAVCSRKPVALRFDTLRGLAVEMTDGWAIWLPAGALSVTYRA